MRYKLNGKYVNKEDIIAAKKKDAELVRTIEELHYETPDYMKEQTKNAFAYFGKMRDDRDELEKRHG